ncbi:MAG: hypothetical protein GYA55_08165 [SAR324 cluster bacterium]|uniref:Glycosyltransferase n=1 Tax=SAR324 cluster bacterium TaxID=2024889 RepID=A0A7X9FSQ6_9DELT|nr:hypothetical protein [SAR324 cluster bacterium]
MLGIKTRSEEFFLFYIMRTLYYHTLQRLSEIELTEHFSGFGLYDREVIELIRTCDDPYPYLRGLIAEFGFESAKIEYTQKARTRGITKNSFYTLYDQALLGLTSHSKVPLRLAAMLGFLSAIVSLAVAAIYLVYKLIFWSNFTLGLAPLVVGLFFFSSVQLFFLGILGEYVASTHTQILKRPLVVERERINFD